jgi:hypothetical protein
MDEMDVSDGCVIVQKMSPLANLLIQDTLTPSIVLSIVEYIETVEIWKIERIMTNSFFKRLSELMKEKKDKYYPILSILTSIAYQHAMNKDNADTLYKTMNMCGIVTILEKECKKVVDSEKGEEKEKLEQRDNIILTYSLIMGFQYMELSFIKEIFKYLIKMITVLAFSLKSGWQIMAPSLLKKIMEYLIKMIEKCIVDSSLLNVEMKAVVPLYSLNLDCFGERDEKEWMRKEGRGD